MRRALGGGVPLRIAYHAVGDAVDATAPGGCPSALGE